MVKHESGWRYDAVGDNGHSIGLTQLHDQGLGAGMTVEQRKDPETNLRTAIAAHMRYFARYGSYEAALVSHNAGGGAVAAANGWLNVVHHRTPDGQVVYVRDVYVYPILAAAERYRQDGVV